MEYAKKSYSAKRTLQHSNLNEYPGTNTQKSRIITCFALRDGSTLKLKMNILVRTLRSHGLSRVVHYTTVQHFDSNEYSQTNAQKSWIIMCALRKNTKKLHVPNVQAKAQLRPGSDEFQMFHISLILNPIIFHKGWNPLLITAFPHEREK